MDYIEFFSEVEKRLNKKFNEFGINLTLNLDKEDNWYRFSLRKYNLHIGLSFGHNDFSFQIQCREKDDDIRKKRCTDIFNKTKNELENISGVSVFNEPDWRIGKSRICLYKDVPANIYLLADWIEEIIVPVYTAVIAAAESQDIDNKLTELIKKYDRFKKSDKYNEQYKWEYAIKNQHIFDNLDNLNEKIARIGSPNFQSYFIRNSGIRWLLEQLPNDLKNSFEFLFNEEEELENRIKDFRGIIRTALINDDGWKNKNLAEPGVDTASFFLFTNNYKKYMLFTKLTPFNNYAKKLDIDYLLKNETPEKRYVTWQDYCQNELIPEMNRILNKDNDLLDAQDFIWFVGSESNAEGDLNTLREELLQYGESLGAEINERNVADSVTLRVFIEDNKTKDAVEIHPARKTGIKIYVADKLLTEELRKETINVKEEKGGGYLRWPLEAEFTIKSEEDMNIAKRLIENAIIKISNNYTEFNRDKIPNKNVPHGKKYWLYAPGENSSKWDEFYNQRIMGIGWDELGDLSQYQSKEEIKSKMKAIYGEGSSYKNDGHTNWQFANEINIGDIIFVKKGRDKIIGRGIVESSYIFDPARNDYKNIRQVNWTHKGEWGHEGKIVIKALTDITPYTEYYKKLENLFSEEPVEDEIDIFDPYSEEDFLKEVFMSTEKYETLKNLLKKKKNVILQGAPGVGKTFAAKRLAYSVIGKQDTNRVKMVQFHQSYGYEDFIMGYRPSGNSFDIKYGPFYEFCKEAEKDNEKVYFFIIDEINRGNLSKIFGELLMLIETDKRNESIRLLYLDEQFSVPDNVHIIGMMNTADRSLAIIDYALRRRFSFFDFEPAFEDDGFKEYQDQKNNEKFNNLIQAIKNLNQAISEDNCLGEGFRIGHSYFCTYDLIDDNWLNSVINYEIIPLLKEYWFDEPAKISEWSEKLKLAIK